MGEDKPDMSRKGQGALEFTILTVTMLLAFAGVFLFMEYQFQQAQVSREQALIQDIVSHIIGEIEVAALAGEGYSRVFFIPQTIIGVPYEIYIHLRDPDVPRSRDEIIIEYQGRKQVYFIPYDITGPFTTSGAGFDAPIQKGYICIRGGTPITLTPVPTRACP